MSSIRRLADNKLSALRLPPTARDVGACTMGRSPSGQARSELAQPLGYYSARRVRGGSALFGAQVLCPYTSANHAYSLAGLKRLQVQANF